MTDFKAIKEGGCDNPDWEFATDAELRDHASRLVKETASALSELRNDEERPPATAAHSIVQMPCHDNTNLARQVAYIGLVAELCRGYGLLVRDVGTRFNGDDLVVCIVICTLADYQRSELEREQGERFLH